jgi:hypothetical protein
LARRILDGNASAARRTEGRGAHDIATLVALVAVLYCRRADLKSARLWELPLVRLPADLDSTVADLRNAAPEGYGGAIAAGLFVEEFVGAHPWVRLEVAGVAFTDRDLPSTPRGGVGVGVRLLAHYIDNAALVEDGMSPRSPVNSLSSRRNATRCQSGRRNYAWRVPRCETMPSG